MRGQNIIAAALVLALLIAPVMAGEKFLWGNPDLSATVYGTNEFSPGADTTLTVKIKNTGLNPVKIVQSTILTSEDLPNTAMLLRVTLEPGSAPVTVKSDQQFVGDLTGGSSATAEFEVKIAKDAAPGVYTLPLILEYEYLRAAEQYGSDTLRYWYRTKTETLPLEINIKKDLVLEVAEVRAEQMNVGTEGYVYLTLRNDGHQDAKKAVAIISQYSDSALVPTDGSVYIGDFGPGSTTTCMFRTSVSSDAEAQTYPLDVYVTYEDEEGSSATSDTVTIGVPVGGKIDFTVISAPVEIARGGKTVIEVVYQNTGATTVYDAQARVSAVDPFTSKDDTAYLGDLAPEETAMARFELIVSNDATIKEYGLNSEIRYRDALDNSQISDTMKVRVQVIESSVFATLIANPVVIALIIAAGAGAAYYISQWKKKQNL